MSTSSARILVVEDDPAIRDLIAEILGRAGYDVQTACDGDVGFTMMQSRPPKLVILDVMMPRTSGFDVLRSIRETEWGEFLPVLMVTAGSRPDRIVEAFRGGASDYLLKPFAAPALLRAVERLLAGQGYEAEPLVA